MISEIIGITAGLIAIPDKIKPQQRLNDVLRRFSLKEYKDIAEIKALNPNLKTW